MTDNSTEGAVNFDIVTQTIELAASGWALNIQSIEGAGVGVDVVDTAADEPILFGLALSVAEAHDLAEALAAVVGKRDEHRHEPPYRLEDTDPETCSCGVRLPMLGGQDMERYFTTEDLLHGLGRVEPRLGALPAEE